MITPTVALTPGTRLGPYIVTAHLGSGGMDGRFLINMELDSAAAPITLIQNWQPDTRK